MVAETGTGLLTLLKYATLAFAPGFFWLWYFRREDDLEPEPRIAVYRVFALGCLGALLILFTRRLWADPLLAAAGGLTVFLDAFVATAIPEETVKFLAFLFGAFLTRELDEPLDGIIYGVAAALGFASVENFLYLSQTGDPWVILLRAFTATLAHVAFTGLLGWFFGRAKFVRGARRVLLPAGGVLLAVLLHGGYDLFLSFEGTPVVSLVILLPFGLVFLGMKIRWSRARSARYHPDRA